MSFASQYESAKAQAIPSLAENVYHAGQRSWRASAWLLERLRPSQFGRRLALGPDVTKIQEHKRQLALLEAERRAKILDDDAIVEVFDRLRGNRQLLAAAKNYLDEILANEAAWDRALARGKDERQDAQQPDDLASSSESATDAPQTEPSSACDEPHPYSDICAPTPSANNSTPNGQQPIPEVEPAQSLPATATPPIAPNLCAFTPIAPSAQIP